MQTLEETTKTLNPPGSETLDPKTLADTQPPAAMPQELGLGLKSGPEVEPPIAGDPAVGDFVWGKIKSHPWWPGRVFDPAEASDQARKTPRKDQSSVLVAYFGDGSFAWCNPSQVKPFPQNFEQMASSGGSKSFRAALDSAVSEIGKILEAELSCNCLPEEERSGVGKYLGGKSGKISNFSDEEFLGLLKDVAVDASAVNVLETAKLRSWVVAFHRGWNVGHKRKAIADLVDKIDLDVPAAEAVEGLEFLNGPEVLSEKGNRGRKKRSMAALIAQMDLYSVEVSDGEEEEESGKDLKVENNNAGGDVKEEEVGSGRRERKKSKYLSPPYTYLSGGFAKSLVSPKSSEVKTPKSPRGLSFGSSPSVVKCSTEGSSKEEEESTPLFQVDGVDVREVLSEFLTTAVNPVHLKWNRSSKVVRGFFAEFRSSVFSSGAKFDAYQKQVSESPGAEDKIENKEVGVKSEEGKQTERKRGRKLKAVDNGDGETPIDKSKEGKKTLGKDMVNGETSIKKSEEGKKTDGKRGRKRKDKVNDQRDTPIDLSYLTSEHSEKKDEAESKMDTMEEGANGKTLVTPKRQKATGLENDTSGRKRGRKKADATQNITVNSGCETVNNVGFGKSGQEQTKGEEVANTNPPTAFDIEGRSQMKEATMGQKRKNNKNRPIVDVPVNLGGRVTNGSGERKPRQKKNNKNSTSNEDPAAVLLSFSTEITLPSKEGLIAAFSKYGHVIQSETEVVKESSSAKVVFGRSSDAEKAFNDKVAALGLPVASYRLRYLTGNLSSPSSATPIPVPKPPLPYIRKSLERMISTLSGPAVEKVVGTSGALKPETRDNLVGEMQGLLMKVDKMLTGPAAADQVYLVLLQNGNLVDEGEMERALEILAETCWEGALEESKIGRLQLYEIAGLEASTAIKASGATVNKSSRMNATTDENASYSSLVDSSGF